MIPLLLAHLAAFVVCVVPGRRSARWALPLASVVTAGTFGWLLSQAPRTLHGDGPSAVVSWVDSLGLSVSLRLDGFGLLMGLIVSGIGTLVLLYSVSYFGRRDDLGRLAGLLVGFAGAMLGIVWAEGLLTLFVFWELTSVASFLLIGFEDRSATARAAAQRAYLVTAGGGLALLAGLILLGITAGTTSISTLLAAPPSGPVVTWALVLVLAGAFTKSAQFPFHFWLPGAMAAPTPVSAYLHSATMVKAGLVVVARFAPVFAPVGPWRWLVVLAGVSSLVLGGFRAMRQQDAKLALAHGTVSQLGFMMVLLGLGTPATTYAGVAMLLAHALFKASLFLSVGIVDHSTGTRDMRRLRGLLRALPITASVIIVASASMAAIPPTLGFVAKEKALDGLVGADLGAVGVVALIGIVAGSVLTVAYTVRIAVGLLGDDAPGISGEQPVATGPIAHSGLHRPSVAFGSAPAVLTALSLALGLAAEPVGHWLAEVTTSLDPATATKSLHLWTGINTPLLLSVGIITAGVATWWFTAGATRSADRPYSLATRAYDRTYDALLGGSRRLTALTQSGSLPLYVGIVLSSVGAALITALVAGASDEIADVTWAHSPVEVALVSLTALMALAVLAARQRFTAAVLLGGSGYLLAIVYLIQGAPDLAITQFLVETLTIVVFLLALARLPRDFHPAPPWAPRPARIAVSVTVGLVVALFALGASHARSAPSVGEDYVALSEPEAGGRNVVNVILVDFRGFDTLGEITVLAVAGAGVVNLVRAARRQQRRKQLSDGLDVEDLSGRPSGVWR